MVQRANAKPRPSSAALDHAVLLDQFRIANRYDPIIEQLTGGMKLQFDLGAFAPERANSRQQPNLQERCQQAYLQRSGAAILLDLVHRGFKLVKAGSYRRQEHGPLFGNFHHPPRAAKHGHLNIRLQYFDLLADRRRCDMERFGSAAETEVRGDRLEHA
ncbi:MAG TPA: hypothetical protein VMV25_03900 [Steroidobacteraceae bacterium]|nr:hypothetical protein [Steroidobacteraceae bacterium]